MKKKLKILSAFLGINALSITILSSSCSTITQEENQDVKLKFTDLKPIKLIKKVPDKNIPFRIDLPKINIPNTPLVNKKVDPKLKKPLKPKITKETKKPFKKPIFKYKQEDEGSWWENNGVLVVLGSVVGVAALIGGAVGLGYYFEEVNSTTKHNIKTSIISNVYDKVAHKLFENPSTNTTKNFKKLLWAIYDSNDKDPNSILSWLKSHFSSLFDKSNLVDLLSSKTVEDTISNLKKLNLEDMLNSYEGKEKNDNLLSLLFKTFETNSHLTSSFLDFLFSLKNSKLNSKEDSEFNLLLSEDFEKPNYKTSSTIIPGLIILDEAAAWEKYTKEQDPKILTEIFKKFLKSHDSNESLQNYFREFLDKRGYLHPLDLLSALGSFYNSTYTKDFDITFSDILKWIDLETILNLLEKFIPNAVTFKGIFSVFKDGLYALKEGIMKIKGEHPSEQFKQKVYWLVDLSNRLIEKYLLNIYGPYHHTFNLKPYLETFLYGEKIYPEKVIEK